MSVQMSLIWFKTSIGTLSNLSITLTPNRILPCIYSVTYFSSTNQNQTKCVQVQLYFNWRFVQNIQKSLFEETGNDVNLKECLLYVGNCVSLCKVVFFNCSAQISVLKRKTFNQQGSFVHPEFHGTESLIGWPSFFILELKIGRNS